jgi:hypothetical protein
MMGYHANGRGSGRPRSIRYGGGVRLAVGDGGPGGKVRSFEFDHSRTGGLIGVYVGIWTGRPCAQVIQFAAVVCRAIGSTGGTALPH